MAQKTHVIEFNAEGKMTVAPPNALPIGDGVMFQVNIDVNSFEKRTLEHVEFYLSTLKKLNENQILNILYPNKEIGKKLGHAISEDVISIVPYLSEPNKLITEKRVKYYDFQITDKFPEPIPKLKALIQKNYIVNINFYNASEKIIESTLLELKETEGFPELLEPYSLETISKKIPDGTASISFELREIEPKNEIIKKNADTLSVELIRDLENSLSNAGEKFNKNFFEDFEILKERANEAKKYLQDPESIALDQIWLDATNRLFVSLNTRANSGLVELETATGLKWMLSWLWLTQEVPKINPFFFQEELLFPKKTVTQAKVTEEEKMLVEMFDNLVKNNAFQIETLSNIFNESQLGQINNIKTRLKAEGVVPPSPFEYDKFLYFGKIISYDPKNKIKLNLSRSRVPITFMASHNAEQGYLLMNKTQKEIKDIDRLAVLIQNKTPEKSLSINLSSIPIKADNLISTEELLLSNQYTDKYYTQQNQLGNEINAFYENFKTLNQKVEFYTRIQKAPKLPIVTVKDKVPKWQTEILNYNPNIDAPAVAEYVIKSGSGDDEKEVYKGQFRVNKRYNLRFKAGVVYSTLEQKDYTKTGDNTFTEEINQAGIDGTFGIQLFPMKTDLRQINFTKGRVAPFLYMGFSMKNILENFYPGIGLEIFSGVSVSYNWHIAKSEVLIGSNSIPQDIETKWIDGKSVSILVDSAFFVNLFKFGTNKSTIGF